MPILPKIAPNSKTSNALLAALVPIPIDPTNISLNVEIPTEFISPVKFPVTFPVTLPVKFA